MDTLSSVGDWFSSAGAGSAAGGAAESAGESSSVLSGIGKTAASAAASAAATSLLTPKPQAPKLPGVTPMPDPVAQDEARRRKIIEQMARRGRASTILTADTGGNLGGS